MRGKAPCPSMTFTRWNSAAISAAAPYIDAPPCGCRLPVTAEQTFEDFCGLLPGSSRDSCIWYSRRRCPGLSPSKADGMARSLTL